MTPSVQGEAADGRAELLASMIKVVYFDKKSASDYLDISAGGKATSVGRDSAAGIIPSGTGIR